MLREFSLTYSQVRIIRPVTIWVPAHDKLVNVKNRSIEAFMLEGTVIVHYVRHKSH